MKTLCITAMIIVISTVTASTQTQRSKGDADAQLIDKVIIRGNRRISESTIKSWISARKDDVYSAEKLDGDVRALRYLHPREFHFSSCDAEQALDGAFVPQGFLDDGFDEAAVLPQLLPQLRPIRQNVQHVAHEVRGGFVPGDE